MRLGIRVIDIVHVVRRHQIYPHIPVHAYKSLVHHFLLGNPVVLKLQEKITGTENTQKFFCLLTGLLIQPSL